MATESPPTSSPTTTSGLADITKASTTTTTATKPTDTAPNASTTGKLSTPPPSSPSTTSATTLSGKIAAATQQYALKNYDAAADLYSEAVTLQAAANGEMALENADLLYAYGRCLYHVAVAKSDVLGGRVAGENGGGGGGGGGGSGAKKRKRGADAGASAPAPVPASAGPPAAPAKETHAEAVLERVVEAKEGTLPAPKTSATPYFTFTGDENWDDSDEEEDADGAEGGAEDDDGAVAAAEDADADEEEEDDFATAYEILDLARVLLARKLEALDAAEQTDDDAAAKANDKGKARAKPHPLRPSPARRQLQERLADTHDLQAEISLENERFADAVTDSRASLALKRALFAPESSIVAEAHFKLSLALEFASVTATATTAAEEAPAAEGGGGGFGVLQGKEEARVDEAMRAEAAAEMEMAIRSSKLRVQKETAGLAALSGEEAAEKKKGIEEVKEIITDMEQRLTDLRNPTVSLSALAGPAGAPTSSDPLRGVLGSILGESAAVQKARIEDAVKGATDLTASIRHKKKKVSVEEGSAALSATAGGAAVVIATNGTAKRKADDGQEVVGEKKARVEDA